MIQPTAVYEPFDGQVKIVLYGTPHDWSLRVPKGADGPRQDVLDRIYTVMKEQGVNHLYAPVPSKFNAQICNPDELFATHMRGDEAIWRGRDADGVVLTGKEREKAFFVNTADCITIVAKGELPDGSTVVIPAHGGRDCLVDRERIDGGKARRHESVVHSIMAEFSSLSVKPRSVKVFLTCGISPYNFTHDCTDEKWGLANTRMVMDIMHKWGKNCLQGDPMKGKLILSQIIRAQFISLGVQLFNIGGDVTDTYDAHRDGQSLWHSYRRSCDNSNGKAAMRNGVFVIHRGC